MRAALDKRTFHGLHQYFRRHRNAIRADAGRMLNRIYDCRRGSIYGQFADALSSSRAVSIRRFFEVNADAREIGGCGHDVICHLAVDHASLAPDHILIEREPDSLSDGSLDL